MHIDELVLHGFAPHERHRVAEAVAAELQRIVTEHGLPEGIGDRDVVRAGSIAVKPAGVGSQIAGAIYKGLGSE